MELNDYLLKTLAQSFVPVTFSGRKPNVINRFLVKSVMKSEKTLNLEPAVNNGILFTLPESDKSYTPAELESNWRYYISNRKVSDMYQATSPHDLFSKETDKYIYALCSLYCDSEMEVMLSIWGLNPIRVWINGRLALTSSVTYNIRTIICSFKCLKGINTFLFERISFPLENAKYGIVERENIISVTPVNYLNTMETGKFFDEGLFAELKNSYAVIPEKAIVKDKKLKLTILPKWFDTFDKERVQIEIKDAKGELLKSLTAYTGEEIQPEIDEAINGVLVIKATGLENAKKSLDTYIFFGNYVKERNLMLQKAVSILGAEHELFKMMQRLVRIPDICNEKMEMAQEELYGPLFKNYFEFEDAVTRAFNSGEDIKNKRVLDIFRNSAMFYEESEIDDGYIAYRVYLPQNYTEDKIYPVVLVLEFGYAMSTIPMAPRYIRRGEFDEAIMVTICARGELNLDYINEISYLKIIDTLLQNFNIDRDRIYAIGACTGGVKTFGLAIRKPDLFAGIASIGGLPRVFESEFLKNIDNLAVRVLLNFEDYVNVALLTQNQIGSPEKTKNYYYTHLAHGEFNTFYNSHGLMKELLNESKEKYPKRIRFNTQEPVFNKSFWVSIDIMADLNYVAKIEAVIVNTNEIKVTVANIKSFSLLLGQKEMKLDNNLNIQVEGDGACADFTVGISAYTQITIINEDQKFSVKTILISGEDFSNQYDKIAVNEKLLGIKELYLKKCFIVRPGKDIDKGEKYPELLIEMLQIPLKEQNRNYKYEMLPESAATEEKLAQGNFIIYISPSGGNSFKEKLLKYSGTELGPDQIIYNNQQFSGDYFALLKTKNPFNPRELMLLTTCNSKRSGEEMIKFLNSFDYNPLFYSDTVIYNDGTYYVTSNAKAELKALVSGKVGDLGKRLEPGGNINTGVEYVAPRNEIEERLVDIWQKVLGVEKIGINDNFFELGGDSLKAVRVIGALDGYSVNVISILQHPTIAELQAFVTRLDEGHKEMPPAMAENLALEYYYLNNGEPDPVVRFLDCNAQMIYYTLKKKVKNYQNYLEFLLQDIVFYIIQNQNGSIYDINLLSYPYRGDIFKLNYVEGQGYQVMSEIEKLLDKGEQVVLGTCARRTPFHKDFEGFETPFTAGMKGHTFLAVAHDDTDLYYVEIPDILNEAYFVPYPKNKSVGIIKKKDLQAAFEAYADYGTIAIDEANLRQKSNLKELFQVSQDNYIKGVYEQDGFKTTFGKEALELLIDLSSAACLRLDTTEGLFNTTNVGHLFEWKFYAIGARRKILRDVLADYTQECNSEVRNDLINILDKSFNGWLRAHEFTKRKVFVEKDYIVGQEYYAMFTELKALEQEIMENLIRLWN